MGETEIIERARARRVLEISPAVARDLRQQAGLTLADVAEALNVSAPAVHRWERGTRIPRGDRARRYLSFLRRAAGEVTR